MGLKRHTGLLLPHIPDVVQTVMKICLRKSGGKAELDVCGCLSHLTKPDPRLISQPIHFILSELDNASFVEHDES